MPKEDIFSKINLKDYNNILENILEQKAFSEDVKNLLLSMFYRIENAYQDYKTVKVNVSQKNYFLQKITQIIKEKCNEIELIKPMSDDAKTLENEQADFIIDKQKAKIVCYPNERILLEALITLNQDDIVLDEKYKLYEKSIAEILYKGNCMNIAEVIRDFNGWSWDITTSQMQSKNINLVYQNLIILLGRKVIQALITGEEKEEIEETEIPNNEILRSKYNNSFGLTKEEVQKKEEIDYIELIKEKLIDQYGEETSKKLLEQLKKVILAIGFNLNPSQREDILKEQKKNKQQLLKMQDNKKFLEDISKRKKEIAKNIKNIDKILADEDLLKQEYNLRNKNLPNKEKIFSISHLRIMLEKERENLLEKIKKYNKQIEPKEFVKIKNELEEENNFFNDLGIEKGIRAREEKQINKLQIIFLECFMTKIEKSKTKTEIKDLIYELRYYEQLPYQEMIISKLEIDKLQEMLNTAEKILIEKACDEKVLTTITKDKKLNTKILSNQFKSKIINLENTNYVLKYQKGILKIEIYDTNVKEEIKQLEITNKVELEVKLNKKIKLWY